MRRYIDTDQPLNIIFHVYIEQGRADRRTLVNSIIQVDLICIEKKFALI
jgi:hypothetical protein